VPAVGLRDIDAGSALGRTIRRLRNIDAGAALARTAKRLLDLLGAAAGLVLLAPLFLLVATIVKISDPAGPVFYRQNRLGLRGRTIGVLKFRTMNWEFSTGPSRPYKTAQEAFTA